MNINATLFAEMVVFMSFVGLTRLYIWPPLIEVLEKRQADIAQGVDDAKAGSKLLQEAEEKSHQVIADAKRQSCGIIDQAESEAQDILQSALAEAKQIQDTQAANAQVEINKQTLLAKKGLEEETLAYVSQVLAKVMGEIPDMPHLEKIVAEAAGAVNEQS